MFPVTYFRIPIHQPDPQKSNKAHYTADFLCVVFLGVEGIENKQQTWNLATQLELQKLYSFPSGIVAWYWGKEFRLQKWQIIPKPKREKEHIWFC